MSHDHQMEGGHPPSSSSSRDPPTVLGLDFFNMGGEEDNDPMDELFGDLSDVNDLSDEEARLEELFGMLNEEYESSDMKSPKRPKSTAAAAAAPDAKRKSHAKISSDKEPEETQDSRIKKSTRFLAENNISTMVFIKANLAAIQKIFKGATRQYEANSKPAFQPSQFTREFKDLYHIPIGVRIVPRENVYCVTIQGVRFSSYSVILGLEIMSFKDPRDCAIVAIRIYDLLEKWITEQTK